MKKTDRGAIRATSPFRFGGGTWFEKSAVLAVMTSDVGSSPHLSRSDRARSSRSERAPAPSETTARKPLSPGTAVEQRPAPEGQAEAADPLRIDVGAGREERLRGCEI